MKYKKSRYAERILPGAYVILGKYVSVKQNSVFFSHQSVYKSRKQSRVHVYKHNNHAPLTWFMLQYQLTITTDTLCVLFFNYRVYVIMLCQIQDSRCTSSIVSKGVQCVSAYVFWTEVDGAEDGVRTYSVLVQYYPFFENEKIPKYRI